jgi:hypothetical protein
MNLLESRRNRRRFNPKVEALEDRSLLSATLTGPGQITTTAPVNHVLITDDGTAIKVFSDNGFVGSFLEGTPLAVKTKVKGSTNLINYDIQGSVNPNSFSATVINASLQVDFGTGNGQLRTAVVASLPVSLFGVPGPISNLGQNSNVQITAHSTSGNTQDVLQCGSLGFGANLSDVDDGGKGSDLYAAQLGGTESNGATLTLKFTGGDGNNTAVVLDHQDIDLGASTNIDLRCQGDKDDHNVLGVLYQGRLQGTLDATADAGPGTNIIDLEFQLQPGSSLGSLTSTAKTGPGAAKVTDVVHKAAADSPTVNETATGVGSGLKQGFFTIGNSPTSVAVTFSGFTTVTPVP